MLAEQLTFPPMACSSQAQAIYWKSWPDPELSVVSWWRPIAYWPLPDQGRVAELVRALFY